MLQMLLAHFQRRVFHLNGKLILIGRNKEDITAPSRFYRKDFEKWNNVQLKRLVGKNKQVRSIHLSKNVVRVDGYSIDGADWLDKEDEFYRGIDVDTHPIETFQYENYQNWEKITVDEDNPNHHNFKFQDEG